MKPETTKPETTKRTRGRPAIEPEALRLNRTIRMSKGEWQRIQQNAIAAGQEVSAYIRLRCL